MTKEKREEKGEGGGREKRKERGERETEEGGRERNTRTGRRETGERSELLGAVLEPCYNWGMPVSSASICSCVPRSPFARRNLQTLTGRKGKLEGCKRKQNHELHYGADCSRLWASSAEAGVASGGRWKDWDGGLWKVTGFVPCKHL